MIPLNTAPVSCIFGPPQGPVDTGNERTPHANARQSCLLPLSSFAGITEGRTDGLFRLAVKKRIMGSQNPAIEKAIAEGLHYSEGALRWADGKPVGLIKPNHKGYWRVTIRIEGVKYEFTAARVVCWVVYGPPPFPAAMVDHINRIRTDDRPENLRWVGPKENALNTDWTKARENHAQSALRNRGEGSSGAKLTETQVREIRSRPEVSKVLAKEYGVTHDQIQKIRRFEHWKHI